MKSICFIIILSTLFFQKTLVSQNLVPNGGFEDTINCPDFEFQLYNTKFWFTPLYSKSTDFFHACDDSKNVGVPKNNFGYQFAKNGIAFIGFMFYSSISNYREYASVRLKKVLSEYSKYEVSFWVNLSNSSRYAVSKSDIGIYLTEDSIAMPQSHQSNPILITPIIADTKNHILKDTLNWVKLTFFYYSSGGEEYLYIGNFRDDLSTSFHLLYNQGLYDFAYYYIDDVSVIKLPDQDISLDSISYTPTCYSENSFLYLHFSNKGAVALDFTVDTVIFTTEVKLNGTVMKNFDLELNNNKNNPVPNAPLKPDSSMSIQIGPVDLSMYGSNYQITVSSFSVRDSNSTNDTLVFDIIPEHREECFELQVPNIFTPNGDGINDFFIIGNAKDKELKTIIYNRWGGEVASFKGNEGWDGSGLPDGVYFYVVVEVSEKSKQTLKGSVTIIR